MSLEKETTEELNKKRASFKAVIDAGQSTNATLRMYEAICKELARRKA